MTKKPRASKNLLIGTSIILLMIALGVADTLLVEKDLLTDWRKATVQQAPLVIDVPQESEGVPKRTGPDVLKVLAAMDFEVQNTNEPTLISQIIPEDLATVHSMVILKDGDRAGIVAWVDTAEVKVYFLALKEALHSTFSPQMQDLVDETQQREGKPVRNLLTFKDPIISEERIVFVRVRERLYEIHVANGMDEVIFELVETLTN